MKKLLIVLSLLWATGFGVAAYADDEMMAGDEATLNLTEEQRKPFQELQARHREERKQLEKSRIEKNEEFRAQQQALRDKHREEIKALLTEEQFKKHQEMMQMRDERKKDKKDKKGNEMKAKHEDHGMHNKGKDME